MSVCLTFAADIKYLQIVIADEKQSDIQSIFEVIYDFIDQAVEPHGFVPDYDREEAEGYEILSPSTLDCDFKKLSLKKTQTELEGLYEKIYTYTTQLNREHPEHPNRILVHCAMGMSRSATATIMYLMRKFSLSLDEAHEFCKAQRQKTEPNDGFVEQLKAFERNNNKFASEL